LKIEKIYSFKRIALGYCAWWLVWATVQTFVLHRLNLSWDIAIIDSVIFNGLIALSGFAASSLYRYYQPGRTNRIYTIAVFAFVIPILFCGIFRGLMQYIYVSDAEYLQFVDASMPVRFVFALMMMSFVNIMNAFSNSLQEQKNRE